MLTPLSLHFFFLALVNLTISKKRQYWQILISFTLSYKLTGGQHIGREANLVLVVKDVKWTYCCQQENVTPPLSLWSSFPRHLQYNPMSVRGPSLGYKCLLYSEVVPPPNPLLKQGSFLWRSYRWTVYVRPIYISHWLLFPCKQLC